MCNFPITMELTLSGLATPALFRRNWVLVTAAMIIVLNLLDGMLTLGVVYAGAATEANPLMDQSMASWGAVGFMVVKCALVSLGVLLLWRLRSRKLAVGAIGALGVVYLLIIAYHVNSVDAIARFVIGSPLVA